jgi:hypothetical protein
MTFICLQPAISTRIWAPKCRQQCDKKSLTKTISSFVEHLKDIKARARGPNLSGNGRSRVDQNGHFCTPQVVDEVLMLLEN